jgi:hypothetical protein
MSEKYSDQRPIRSMPTTITKTIFSHALLNGAVVFCHDSRRRQESGDVSLKSSGVGGSSEDERDAKDSRDNGRNSHTVCHSFSANIAGILKAPAVAAGINVCPPTGEVNGSSNSPAQPANDLPDGWTTRVVPRKSDNPNSRRKSDTYWFSPQNSYKFNSKPRVHLFCAFLEQVGGDEAAAFGLYSIAKSRKTGNAPSKVESANANTDKKEKRMPSAPLPDAHLETFDRPNFFNECCRRNLTPAKIPHNPLDDDSDDSLALEKEIAWLVEESKLFFPASQSGTLSENCLHLPINLDFAWRHGSLELREKIGAAFLTEISTLFKKWNGLEGNNATDLTLVDGIELIRACTESQPDPCSENIIRLRREACSALQIGFRRSEIIRIELNEIQSLKWREEVRHSRKRPTNDALLRIALGESLNPHSSFQSDAEVASQIPSLLTQLEDEIAWLAEESLILLPRGMIDDHNAASTHPKQIESMVSAGLVTQCDIDWNYIASNASEKLKDELVKIGGIKCRPLQRIVRWHQKEVKVAFQKRRSDISLLLLRGYRRNETNLSLPSHELLVETGLYNVWAVRQMRRRHNEVVEESVSSKDLRLACNARMGDTRHPEQSPKRKKCDSRTSRTLTKSHEPSLAFIDELRSSIPTAEVEDSVSSKDLRLACYAHFCDTNPEQSPKRQKCASRTSRTPTKSHGPSLAFSDKSRSSILTAEEEEIAWVSDEAEIVLFMQTCYRWAFSTSTTQSIHMIPSYERSTNSKQETNVMIGITLKKILLSDYFLVWPKKAAPRVTSQVSLESADFELW